MQSLKKHSELIVKFNGDILSVCKKLDSYAEIIDCNYAIVTIPENNINSLYDFTEIEYYEPAKRVTSSLLLKNEMSNTYILPVKNGRYNLNGDGVIVGIIDSGIDYTHKSFINSDGTSRILYIWNQSADGKAPDGFIYGTEYNNDEINNALKSGEPYKIIPNNDIIGHGTAVSGIAAGNEGVASKSSIISVKIGHGGTERTTDILRAVKYITDKAILLKKPLAINISYGMNDGSHIGNSLFEQSINAMCGKWKTSISAASGNEGGSGHHFSTILSSGDIKEAEFICPFYSRNLYLDIWKSFNDTIDFELISPDGNSSGFITSNDISKRINFGNLNVYIAYKPINHYNIRQEIVFSFDGDNDNFIKGIWKLLIICRNAVDGKIDIWLPTVGEVSENTAFLKPDNLNTQTLPSTAQNVISVSGYNSRLGSLAVFSGKGIESATPDITAPATDILTCKSGGGYDAYSGTSMASPFVCGASALMMEWGIAKGNRPFLYGQMVKAYLIKGASRNKNIVYPDTGWGYGTLNLNSTMEILNRDMR